MNATIIATTATSTIPDCYCYLVLCKYSKFRTKSNS